MFVNAHRGFLYLSNNDEKIWLESKTDDEPLPEDLEEKANTSFKRGQTCLNENAMFIPLVIHNNAIGVACFYKIEKQQFTDHDLVMASNLATNMAGSLKNIVLFEQNLKMERLAAIGRTTSMVIHEMKNILQIGMFSSDWIIRGIADKNEKYLKRGSEGIEKAIKDLNGFIYEMLSLTKDYQIQPQPISYQAILDELFHDLEPKAKQFNVNLDFQLVSKDLRAEGEERSIFRALLNIVKNAIEASDKPDAFIRIRVQEIDPEYYQVTIEDNGQGMSDEVKANIFQAFFSTKGEKGTGLGLMIIDRTVKAHQGKIQVESTFGQGTCFTLIFPKKIAVTPSEKKS